MKKVFGLILFCFIICLAGCAEKNRLTTPLMTVAIDPVEKITVTVGVETDLSAVIRDAGGNFINQPVVWSIDDSNVGSFSSTTSINTTFTALSAGDAVITLTCSGISSTVAVTVS
ncbi:MAG: hypothetical protein PHR82_03965 [Endomicrobiaceae bacterium]|nr:hypothetical protein [Endomicrobiaceae bacterium]